MSRKKKSFTLSESAAEMLRALTDWQGISQTAVLEQTIRETARRMLPHVTFMQLHNTGTEPLTPPARFAGPLTHVQRRQGEQWECTVCPMTLPEELSSRTTIVEVGFYTGPHTGHVLRYCEAHFAQIVAELQAAHPPAPRSSGEDA